MLLRSSSTPVLGSAVTVAVTAENSDYDYANAKPLLPAPKRRHGHGRTPSLSDETTRSLDAAAESSLRKGFRRAQSDGDLNSLAASYIATGAGPGDCSGHRRRRLQPIPSFRDGEDGDDGELGASGAPVGASESRSSAQTVMAATGGDAGVTGAEMQRTRRWSGLYLACGIGIDGGGGFAPAVTDFGSGGGGHRRGFKKNGSGGRDGFGEGGGFADMEVYYQSMLQQEPGNALLLRNYAQFLHERKGDYGKAEEMYSRAILADPTDGDVLARYAKLTWEWKRDEETASGYFEQAAKAASDDCDVLAAYASFLWETDDNDDDEETQSSRSGLHGNVYDSRAAISA